MKNHLLSAALLLASFQLSSQCIGNAANIYSFSVNTTLYEIVKEKLSWVNASACAGSRGGGLAEINSKAEQDTLFYHLNLAGINPANTVAPDGGGASYVWLGGNDRNAEGQWFWDGINAGSFLQFWQGNASGSPVNGAYTNWGNEPDDFNGQDGLGLAITNWPLGLAGQWNDVDESNPLYYVIERGLPIPTALPETEIPVYSFYPQPAQELLYVKGPAGLQGLNYSIADQLGKAVQEGRFGSGDTSIDLNGLAPGLYFIRMNGQQGPAYKLVKQ